MDGHGQNAIGLALGHREGAPAVRERGRRRLQVNGNRIMHRRADAAFGEVGAQAIAPFDLDDEGME